MEIIPAIDLIDGNCVRLTQGDYNQKTIYNQHPLEVAQQFEEAGIQRLHLVDLDGARNGKLTNLKVLESIAAKTKLVVDFGGGIKTSSDIQQVLNWPCKNIAGSRCERRKNCGERMDKNHRYFFTSIH